MKRYFIAVLVLSVAFCCQAQASYLSSEGSTNQGRYLLAENEEDSYDPFSDYSEFDEASDEEADIHFFRNGRFLTVGFSGGMKGFTDNLTGIYSSGGTYGLFLSYFFDMRFALQFGFNTGDYPYTFSADAGSSSGGNVAFTLIQIDLKYYFNTQNITKGLADLNPYFVTGLADVFRTYTVTSSTTGTISNAKDSAWGLDLGAGLEIPMMKKKGYFGFQYTFHYVTFPDSGSRVWLSDHSKFANQIPTGYQYDLLAILGINF